MTVPPEREPYRFLVVEDEGLIAHDIAQRLEGLGHTVIGTASTAEEALELAPQADIVLMDIRIDGPKDGIETAQEIRARCRLPVIFLTAHADRATLERAKMAEPFGYLVKPLGGASLQPVVEMAIYKHRTERALEEKEAWLSTTLASVADAVVVSDTQGRVRILNPAAERMTGWARQNAVGQPTSRVISLNPEEGSEGWEHLAALALLRDEAVPLGRACTLLSRDGRQFAVEGSIAPVRTGHDTLGTVLTLRDVSVQRWEETQLRQAQRAEAAARVASQAAADYTHLVALIREKSEQLLRQLADYSPARSLLEEIQGAAAEAARTTRRLEVIGARYPGQRQIFSLNGLVRRISKLITSVAEGNIRVRFRTSERAGQVSADPSLLEQAVMSLVIHACSTMPDGGVLLLETGTATLPDGPSLIPYASLALTYSGTEQDFDRLFDLMSLEDTGIALPVVHAILSESGGFVSAQQNPSGGSRLEVLLPQVGVGAALLEAGPAAAAATAPAILLVEPSESVRLELHNYFESAGYNLLEAAGVNEAVALGLVHEGALHVLVARPDEARRILKELGPLHPETRLVAVLEMGEPEPEGAARTIHRPFTRKQLLERVSALLGQKPLAAA